MTQTLRLTIVYYRGEHIHCLVLYTFERPDPPITLSWHSDIVEEMFRRAQCQRLTL